MSWLHSLIPKYFPSHTHTNLSSLTVYELLQYELFHLFFNSRKCFSIIIIFK